MPTRLLRTGTALSELGFGTAPLGNLYTALTDAVADETAAALLASGATYVDTAPHYGLGLAERRLGRALARDAPVGLTLSTKVGRLLVDSPGTASRQDDEGFAVPAAVRRVWDFSRDGVLRSLEDSLERLDTDRVDVVYLHDPDEHWAEASTTGVAALTELRDQGVVGAVGAGMNQAAMLTEFVRRTDVDVVMVAGRLTLVDQGALTELLPLAAARGVSVVAAGAYNSGLLSSSTVADEATFDYHRAPRDLVERARALARTCREHGVELPAAALQYPLRHPAVASVVVGVAGPRHVQDALDGYWSTVPEDLWRELDESGVAPDPARARDS